MFEYSHLPLPEIQADALVNPINCVGDFNRDGGYALNNAFPGNLKALKTCFDDGEIEPGNLYAFATAQSVPRFIFNFATRLHWKSLPKTRQLESGLDELVEQTLKRGITSIAIPELASGESGNGISWPDTKLRILVAFSRTPDLKLILCSPTTPNPTPKKRITLFTDGGAEPNPGVGGYGVVLRFGDSQKELSAGFQLTNNNRMELLAAVAGLEALKETCHVRLHSDSRYIVDAVNTGLLFRWHAARWRKSKGKNFDLWKRFLDAYLQHEVEMIWVKGHAGINDNERCDQLASSAIKSRPLLVDDGYEKILQQKKKKRTDRGELISADQNSQLSATTPPATQPNNVSPPHQSADSFSKETSSRPKKVGDPCRNCGTSVVRRETKQSNPNSAYYYTWYLFCNNCSRLFHVDEAKVIRKPNPNGGQ